MRFRIEQHFDGPLLAVEAAFVDADYLRRLGELPKLGAPVLVDQEVVGDRVRQRVRYAFAGEVNAAVRKVVDPKRLTWVEESELDRQTHRTTWRIVPDHYGSMIRGHGTFSLSEVSAARTRRVTEAELRVNVPFVGGKVERAIVSGLKEHAAAEESVLSQWLQGRGRNGP